MLSIFLSKQNLKNTKNKVKNRDVENFLSETKNRSANKSLRK